MKILRTLSALLLTGWLVAAAPASATATLTVSDGLNTMTAMSADPLNPLSIDFIAPFTVWNITGTGHNNSGIFGFPFLDLSVSGATSGGGGSLHIMYTVDGFNIGTALDELFSGVMTANPPNSGFFTWGFCVNGQCVNPPLSGDPSGITLTDLLVNVSGPFSITLFETLEPQGRTSYSNDLVVHQGGNLVPEPGTLLLIGVALLAIVLVRRQRTR